MEPGLYRYPIAAFILSVVAKLGYFYFMVEDEDIDVGVRFAYLLFFLIALVVGLATWKQSNPRSKFTEDVKTGMKIASVYAILLSAFTWIYYSWINPAYFAGKINEAVGAASEETLEQVQSTASFIFDPFTHSTITLFGTVVIGFFYVLVLTLLLRWQAKQLYQE